MCCACSRVSPTFGMPVRGTSPADPAKSHEHVWPVGQFPGDEASAGEAAERRPNDAVRRAIPGMVWQARSHDTGGDDGSPARRIAALHRLISGTGDVSALAASLRRGHWVAPGFGTSLDAPAPPGPRVPPFVAHLPIRQSRRSLECRLSSARLVRSRRFFRAALQVASLARSREASSATRALEQVERCGLGRRRLA